MDRLEQLLKNNSRVENANYHPLNIGRLTTTGGRKIYGLAVEATPARTRSLPYILSGIAQEYRATVNFIQYSMPNPTDKTAKAIVFLDLTDSSISPTELLNISKKLRGILSAKLIEPTSTGVLYDSHFFPLAFGFERAVVFRKEIYEALIKKLRKRFGTGALAFLYFVGVDIGENAYESYVQLIGSEDTKSLTDIAKAVNVVTGWGIVDVVTLDKEKETAIVRVYGSFECELGKGTGKAYSSLYKGAMAGFFGSLFKREVKIDESKCIAKGDDYCEFLIT